MRVGNDHYTRGDSTGGCHDYCETVEVEHCESSEYLFALAFSGLVESKVWFLRINYIEWYLVGNNLKVEMAGDVELLRL